MPVETWSVSTGTADFVVGVDKKLWVRSGLFENFKSFFGTHGAVFGSKSFVQLVCIECSLQMQQTFLLVQQKLRALQAMPTVVLLNLSESSMEVAHPSSRRPEVNSEDMRLTERLQCFQQ